MRNILRDMAWCVDAMLDTWWPLERQPSLWDLEAEALARKEAEEDVAEPQLWEPPLTFDELVAVRQLIEERFGVQSSPVEHRADAPGVVSPEGVLSPEATPSGHPNLNDPMFWPSDLFGAAQTLLCLADGRRRKANDHDEHLRALGARLAEIASAMK